MKNIMPAFRTFPYAAGLIGFALLFGSSSVRATSFFVSPTGTSSAQGTLEDPWDIKTAFDHPSAVTAGDTIYLRGGVYLAPDHLNYNLHLEGRPDAYITVRPFGRERAIIDGGVYIHRPWVILRGLTIRNSHPLRVSKESGSSPGDVTRPTGVNVSAPNVRIINCVIHDTANGIGSWREAPDNDFYGNIIFHNGWSGPDRSHGHGMYMQNSDGQKTIRENIIFNNFDIGVQLYGSDQSRLDNFLLRGNVIFGNGSPGGEFKRNILLGGGVVAHNPSFIENYTYYPLDSAHGGDNNIGYYSSGRGCSNLSLTGNYFVSAGFSLTLHACTVQKLTNNTFIGPVRGLVPAAYPDNKWSSGTERPAGLEVFVRPNEYESGRAHIIIYNWDRLESVPVDLSRSGLEEGAAFEIRDVQDLSGPPVAAGFYRGDPVEIPMTRKSVSQLLGEVLHRPGHTDREFGVFLVRKIGGTETSPIEAHADSRYFEEAESAALESGVTAAELPHASGGRALLFASEGGYAVHWFQVPAAGEYVVWLRIRRQLTEPGLISWIVDEEQSENSELPAGVPGQWQWIALNAQGEGERIRMNPRPVYLTPGWHRVLYRSGQPGLAVDTFFVTNDFPLTRDSSVLAGATAPASTSAPVN